MTANAKTSIRMRRPGGGDLDGYIFTDEAHARRWLQQGFVADWDIRLERVELKNDGICPHCRGSGTSERHAKVIQRLSVAEFLGKS